MIAQFTVVFGINSTRNVQNSIRLRLMLFWTFTVTLLDLNSKEGFRDEGFVLQIDTLEFRVCSFL